MSKKIKNREIITDIYNDERVIKTNRKFKHKKHILEVVFVDNTEYEQSLLNQEVGSIYLYDDKGKNHVLIITKNHYEKDFKDLYTPSIILKNLRFFVEKKHIMKFGQVSLVLAFIVVIIANIFIILEKGLFKVIYIPIISAGVLVLLFFLFSKILEKQYKNLQEELMTLLKEENPNIEKRIEQEKKLFK